MSFIVCKREKPFLGSGYLYEKILVRSFVMTELQSGLNTPKPIVDNPLIEFKKKYEIGETVVKRSL